MIHLFKKGESEATILLLHGTGGNEKDMLDIGFFLNEKANLLSIRGSVLENGMARFFKRFSPGVYDVDDLNQKTLELHNFILWASHHYKFALNKVTAFGFSNGANMLVNYLFHYNTLKKAILSHPIIPNIPDNRPSLGETKLFIGAGENDPLTTIDTTEQLITLFTEQGADVITFFTQNGHQLTHELLQEMKTWLRKQIS